MEDSQKVVVPLNPRALEFFPANPGNPKFIYHPPPPPLVFPFNNQFAYYPSYQIYKPAKTFNAKPGKPSQPHRLLFCNRKVLPPRLLKQKVWVHKNRNLSPPEEPKPKSPLGDKSSVMIRNIPNNFGRKDLLKILDNHCRKENKEADKLLNCSSYDFLYLPMDFLKHANLGYAFVNFTSSVAAERFRREFEDFSWTNFGNNKICKITVAKYQGKAELSEHFKNSYFRCQTDEYLPVVLSPPSDGFTDYSLTTLGDRVGARGGGHARCSRVC